MFNTITKIIRICKTHEKDLVFLAIIVLIAIISFGLGRLSKIRESKIPLTIENINPTQINPVLEQKQVSDGLSDTAAAINSQKTFVASKSGKKYHYAWCASASGIKKENKVWFSTKEEAQAAGYEPAANCKGL